MSVLKSKYGRDEWEATQLFRYENSASLWGPPTCQYTCVMASQDFLFLRQVNEHFKADKKCLEYVLSPIEHVWIILYDFRKRSLILEVIVSKVTNTTPW